MPNEIREFLLKLIDQSGLEISSNEEREGILTELYQSLEHLLITRIIKNLSETDADSFIQLNQSATNQTEVNNFLTAKLPNYQQIVNHTFQDFAEDYTVN